MACVTSSQSLVPSGWPTSRASLSPSRMRGEGWSAITGSNRAMVLNSGSRRSKPALEATSISGEQPSVLAAATSDFA